MPNKPNKEFALFTDSAPARSHPCAAPACPRQIAPHLLMCSSHWVRVPVKIQVGLNRAWRLLQRSPLTQNWTAYHQWRREAILSVSPAPALKELSAS